MSAEQGSSHFQTWCNEHEISQDGYYLIVGRFVPENNFETIIREFLRSETTRILVIVTNENEALLNQLEGKLHYKQDQRIKFVGTVYDKTLLREIRENALAYIHGHEVGGTNPSLLEALSSTKLNLLLDVGFNREVAEDAALYWTKKEGSLTDLIQHADDMSKDTISRYAEKARKRIRNHYSWDMIAKSYEELFYKESINEGL